MFEKKYKYQKDVNVQHQQLSTISEEPFSHTQKTR